MSDSGEAWVLHAMDIDDSYHVERTLANGPRGVTELVTHNGAGPFVRKRMPLKLANRVVWAMLAECDCSRLPHVQTTFETPDEFVVVYEFVEGDTLTDFVGQRARLTVDEALPIFHEVCEAVAALHAHGIVHRDLTPSNIILGEDGAHLIDLGIARFVEGPTDDQGEVPLGTWGFAAPEQHGFGHTDVRSDIYSLGRVLAFALTGIMPKSDGFDQALANVWLVPPAIAHVIEKACEFEPSARYQHVEELVKALDDACVSHSVAALSAAQPKPPALTPKQSQDTPKPVARRRGATAVLAVVGFVVLAALAVLVWWWLDGRASVQEQPSEGDAVRASAQSQASDAGQLAKNDTGHAESVVASDLVDSSVTEDLPDESAWQDGLGTTELSDISAASSRMDKPSSSDSASAEAASAASSPDAVASSGGVALPSGKSLVEQAVESLEITETGYSPLSSRGFMTVVGIRNTSDDLLVELPGVRVTGRSDEGTIVSNSVMGVSFILPGQTIYMAWPMEASQTPDELEFSLVEPRDYNVSHWDAGTPTYVLDNVAELQGRNGVSFTGEVTLSGDLSVLQAIPYVTGLQVIVILRDGEGNAISGSSTSLAMPSEGETVPFSIDFFDSLPDYESFEVYAYLS